MSDKPSIEDEELTKEVKNVLTNFFKKFKEMFMSGGASSYELARKCGKDPKTFKEMIENCDNCEVRSLIQILKVHDCTIEINIVPLKK